MFDDFFPATMTDLVPPGVAGEVKVEHFEISEDEARFGNLRASMRRDYDAVVRPGRYVKLVVGGQLMMSDTPMERRTNIDFARNVKGRVLIAGLGIGMILHKLEEKPEVTEVVVVEKYPEVVSLVGPTVGPKVKVVTADIFEWKPAKGEKFDTIYADIWPDICTDNLKEITRFKRRFCRYLAPGGWLGAWCEDRLRSQLRRERRAGW